jgi:hypothetical protein
MAAHVVRWSVNESPSIVSELVFWGTIPSRLLAAASHRGTIPPKIFEAFWAVCSKRANSSSLTFVPMDCSLENSRNS